MNFAQVQQSFGQQNEKGYQVSTTMCGVIAEIGASKLDRNGKAYMSCKVQDDNNSAHNVTIRSGSKGFPSAEQLGKRCMFSIQPYQGQKGMAFSGFYNGLATPAPFQGQQAAPHPRQPANSSQPTQSAPKGVLVSGGRIEAVNAACQFYTGSSATNETVLEFAKKITCFFATGEIKKMESFEQKYNLDESEQFEQVDEPREPGEDEVDEL